MKPINKITEEEIIGAVRQVEEDSEIIEAFKSVSEEELKEILLQEREKKSKAETSRIWFYAVSSVAAAVLVLFLLNVFKKDSSRNHYLAYFDMPKYESPFSRGTSKINESFFDLYNKGQYQEALDEIKPMSEDDLAEETLLKFYVSVCYMKVSDFPKATKYLSELHDKYPHWPEAQWYLALCYLNEKQTDKAKELLQKIDDEKYTDKAKELLEKLK